MQRNTDVRSQNCLFQATIKNLASQLVPLKVHWTLAKSTFLITL